MAHGRFPTLSGLYEAFPTAAADVALPADLGLPAGDDECMALLRSLTAAEAWAAAVSLCAYLLPRREAVWWGCQSLRAIQREAGAAEASAIAAAEAWARRPDEESRRMAFDIGEDADAGLPAIWMARAAGWSGGSVVPPDFAPVRPPPEQTARCVRAGLLIAMSRIPPEAMGQAMAPCLARGAELVRAGAGAA